MKKKAKKPRNKQLQTKAENLWKAVCLARDKGCVGRRFRSCNSDILQVHHVIGRGNRRSFLEIINGVTLCKSCHFFLHHNDIFRMTIEDYAREQNGFERLKDEVRQGGAFLEWSRIGWLEHKIEILEEILKGLEEGIYE